MGEISSAILLSALLALPSQAEKAVPPPGPAGSKAIVYKQTAKRPLYLHILSPAQPKDGQTAIVFFFGGGWSSGSVLQFAEQGKYFTSRGRVCIFVDYRVRSKDNSTPFDSVEDAQDAIRWVRSHAAELNVAPDRIVAAGGSAGGHLAAAAAVFDGAGNDASARPNALVLYNPVVDTTEHGYGAKTIGERARDLSPFHHLRRGLPPTIIFHGTSDRTVPFANAEAFTARMKSLGNRCELVPFEGADHGFFNSLTFRPGNSRDTYQAIMDRSEKFLESVGL